MPPSSSSAHYLLAELATMPRRKSPDPDAVLFLWRSRSDEQPAPQWERKEVRLPREVKVRWAPGGDDKHEFCSDTSFAGPGGCLCWVDLLNGIVVCTNPLVLMSVRGGDGEEDVVVYAVVNDIEERVVVQGRQVVLGTELEFKRQFVLGIDLRRNRIVSTSSGVPPDSLMQMMPRLLSVDSARTASYMTRCMCK